MTSPAAEKRLKTLLHAAFDDPTNPVKGYYPARVVAGYCPVEEYVDDQLEAVARLQLPIDAGLGDLDALAQGYCGIAVELAHLYTLDLIRSGCEDAEDRQIMRTRGTELAVKLKASAATLAEKARAFADQMDALAKADVPAWQRPERDRDARLAIMREINRLLQLRKPDADKVWRSKLPEMAGKLETRLYATAKSLKEYADETTLTLRLQNIARDLRRR